MATWTITPADAAGVTTNSTGIFNLPANSSQNSITYTISVTSDTNCVTSKTYDLPECYDACSEFLDKKAFIFSVPHESKGLYHLDWDSDIGCDAAETHITEKDGGTLYCDSFYSGYVQPYKDYDCSEKFFPLYVELLATVNNEFDFYLDLTSEIGKIVEDVGVDNNYVRVSDNHIRVNLRRGTQQQYYVEDGNGNRYWTAFTRY